jgi:hypothetical protein
MPVRFVDKTMQGIGRGAVPTPSRPGCRKRCGKDRPLSSAAVASRMTGPGRPRYVRKRALLSINRIAMVCLDGSCVGKRGAANCAIRVNLNDRTAANYAIRVNLDDRTAANYAIRMNLDDRTAANCAIHVNLNDQTATNCAICANLNDQIAANCVIRVNLDDQIAANCMIIIMPIGRRMVRWTLFDGRLRRVAGIRRFVGCRVYSGSGAFFCPTLYSFGAFFPP